MVVKRELDFSDLQKECWSGAVDTLQTIWEHDKEEDFMDFLEIYFVGTVPTMTEVNNLLWFEDEWIFEQIDLDPNENEDKDDDDCDDYDEDFEHELLKGDDKYTERVVQEMIERS